VNIAAGASRNHKTNTCWNRPEAAALLSIWAIWEGEQMTDTVIVYVIAMSACVSAFVTFTVLAAFR